MPTECVILYRNKQNGKVGYVSDGEDDKIAVYNDHDGALRDVPNIPILRVSRYQIVELEDL
jgi:hypothetical protein